MDLLNKQLTNKENQFREMSIQLMNHLKKINLLSAEIEEVKSGNEVIKKRIEEKDVEIANLLKEKLEMLDVLDEIENIGKVGKEGIVEDMNNQVQDVESKQNVENQEESKVFEDKKVEDVKEPESNKVDDAKEVVEEEEETYISDNIDITSELEKLGLVDLVKKY